MATAPNHYVDQYGRKIPHGYRLDRYGLPHPDAEDRYVPLDAQGRADTHTHTVGAAATWPIPLTRAGEPSMPAVRAPAAAR